ncbi:MAG TPA: tyrosine-type recombinase/integrase [Rubrobacter sp.]
MPRRGDKKNPNGAGTDARRRKDGRYETRATLDTPTGRMRVSFYGKTAEEANNKKFKALADRAEGKLFADPGRLTVADYLDGWLADSIRYQVAESSRDRYESICRVHLKPFFGRLRLRALSTTHVRALKAKKIDEGLHPTTVGQLQRVLSMALNQAVADGLIPSNPAGRVKKAASRGKRSLRSLSLEEASRLTAAEGTRDEALILVALRTGLRQGELAALRWEDVDLASARPVIAVRRSANTRTSTVRLTTTKTGEERRVRIGPRTVEILKAHRVRQRKERMAAKSWEDPGIVFPNRRGKIRRRDSVIISFRRLLQEAALPLEIRFHDLRHTAGTLALRQGMPLHAVSKMLGHADPAMTLRRYAHVLEDMEDEGGQAMDELF